MSIRLEHISLDYQDGGIVRHAIRDVSLEIEDNTFVGLIGHTGSGKSSLIQHMNGLIRPTAGKVFYNGEDIYQEGYSLRQLRNKVGLVFQYPEHQLFEESVFKDVCYGPKNQGLTDQECQERAREALRLVGFPEEAYKKSPFELSGGQKRRAAIAGVMAMQPKCIILDEPTAMLDPDGRKEVIRVAHELNQKKNITVILITHYMEEVVDSDYVYVMDKGKIVMEGVPKDIFSRVEELKSHRMDVPQITLLAHELKRSGIPVPEGILHRKELINVLNS